MNADDFLFHLPEHLIAAHPAPQRDASRLLVVPPDPDAAPLHHHFRDLTRILRPGDVLVMNNSRVIPARLFGTRVTGGHVEVLLLEKESDERHWRALVRPARKLHPGEVITLPEEHGRVVIEGEHEGGERSVRLDSELPVRELLQRVGHLPLPPYILQRRKAEQKGSATGADLHLDQDRDRYQTVYARTEGSVAAPTAGLHFTPELLHDLSGMGISQHFVTLHVGAGTFQGMAEGSRIEDHVMHEEQYEIDPATADAINAARPDGRRIIAVGTTTVRTLESAWDDATGSLRSGPGRTRIMIRPGDRLRAIDALITNFHLPRSTLLLLVSAIVGRERLLATYAHAIAHGYRFFSYGDAMMVSVDRKL